jgi:hypothetical protein
MFIGRTPSYFSLFGVKMYLMIDICFSYVWNTEDVPTCPGASLTWF